MVTNFSVLLMMVKLMKLKVALTNGTVDHKKAVYLLDGSKMVNLRKDMLLVVTVKNLTHIDNIKSFFHFSYKLIKKFKQK